MFGTNVSDIQSNVSLSRGKIRGTLKYLDSGAIVDEWGEGNFLVLKFTTDDWSDFTSVKVGLDPSQSSGLVELINDPDKNGVFKITDKDNQKFVVVATDGTHTTEQRYDLSGLTLLSE